MKFTIPLPKIAVRFLMGSTPTVQPEGTAHARALAQQGFAPVGEALPTGLNGKDGPIVLQRMHRAVPSGGAELGAHTEVAFVSNSPNIATEGMRLELGDYLLGPESRYFKLELGTDCERYQVSIRDVKLPPKLLEGRSMRLVVSVREVYGDQVSRVAEELCFYQLAPRNGFSQWEAIDSSGARHVLSLVAPAGRPVAYSVQRR